jgi:hypothetical protein
MVSASISTGVSPSSTVATTVGACTQVAGSGAGTTGIVAVVVVLGIKVATPDDSSLLAPAIGNGDSDGSITDIGAIIELDCCCDEPLLLLLLLLPATVELTTSVDSRFRNSSELTKSSSSLV